MIWLGILRVHDISRMGDHMIHILMLFWPENRSTTPIQCRHIEHMHVGVWFRKNNF